MNAVIYARYSSHNQTEQSIEGQLRDNYAWAKQQNITVVGEYIDRALSGKTDTRPDFQRMIADAAKKQFEIVIVWKLDRFARNRYDSAIYKAKLKKYGVRVVSVKENITDSPEGIILEGLLESMAEYYSANLAQNILRGKRETLKKGMWNGGYTPYGYKVVDRKLVIDGDTAPAIRYLFSRYAAGASKKQIIDELNNQGYRTSSGEPLAYQSFSKTLQNPIYTGNYVFKGEVIPGLAERIIDDETFQKVQEKIKINARKPAAFKAKAEYLLSGKIFCGYCGYPMVGESGRSKNGSYYNYYACATRKKKNRYEDIPVCSKKNEKKVGIEDYVIDQTLKYILTPDHIEDISKTVVQEYNKEFDNSEIKVLERKIKSCNYHINKLLNQMLDMPDELCGTIKQKYMEYERQRLDYEADLAKLKITSRIKLTEGEVKEWLCRFCKGELNNSNLKQSIIDTFVNSVYIYEDRVVVFYNVPGAKTVTYEDLTETPEFLQEKRCSDLNTSDGAEAFKSEHEPLYIFVRGILGCIFFRNPPTPSKK